MSDIFSYEWGGVGIYLQILSLVVIEGSRGLGRRLERQDEGSSIDFKNLRESCSRRSAMLEMAAQYSANVRHVISVTVDDSESSPLYSFNLVDFS